MSISRISLKGTPLMGVPKKFTNHPSSTLTFQSNHVKMNNKETNSHQQTSFINQSNQPNQQPLPSVSEWGEETWKVLDRAVQMYEFIENENPPEEILQNHADRLKMYFLGMPSSLPCWKCIRHSTQLIEQREPDTSSAKALREWFEWFKHETNKHVQEQKQERITKQIPRDGGFPPEHNPLSDLKLPQISFHEKEKQHENVDPEMLRMYKLIENKNTILRNAALHGWKPKSCSSC